MNKKKHTNVHEILKLKVKGSGSLKDLLVSTVDKYPALTYGNKIYVPSLGSSS